MKKKILRDRGAVYFNEGVWETLQQLVTELQPSKVFVLTDTHTKIHCLPYVLDRIKTDISLEVLCIPAGEAHKNIASSMQLWEELSSKGADRNSLLINVGGGVVTDLGGFVAATYQRGIEWINIPTSLLAMVDASVGGKNGVDLGVLKNQIGIIKHPKAVIVDTQFLSTLPKPHFISGMAEMIKHGFIHSEGYLDKVMAWNISDEKETSDLIWESICIKNEVITADPFEQGVRKTLNYGHTLGHAIESYCLQHPNKEPMLHGEAISVGLILANYISMQQFGFPKKTLEDTTHFIKNTFGNYNFTAEEVDAIIKLLIHDKKNSHGKVRFVLLESIGEPKMNCSVSNDQIHNAFKFYKNYHS